MFFLSFILHALILSVILFIPAFPTPKWTFGPVYSVQLVDRMPSLARNEAEIPFVGQGQDTRQSVRSVPMRKTADFRDLTPIRRINPGRQPSVEVQQALDAIRKGSQRPVRQTPTAPVVTPAGSGPAMSVNESEREQRMQSYYSQVWKRIKKKWTYPPGVVPPENLEAVVDLQVLRNGAVVNVKFERRSGNRYFDESVLRAIGKASPMPPLPDMPGDNSMDIGIRFHASDLP
ncbi:MAG: energy transducer TonB [Syntrophales bacterium]|jgi:TonB family protein